MKKLKLKQLINEVLQEEKSKRDRCLRIADRKFDKPSAYKSGAVVRCRKGNIWKYVKEADNPQAGKAAPYGSGFAPVKELVTDTKIICDNCGWSWKIEDGGNDLYICHKCGHDNEPIK